MMPTYLTMVLFSLAVLSFWGCVKLAHKMQDIPNYDGKKLRKYGLWSLVLSILSMGLIVLSGVF